MRRSRPFSVAAVAAVVVAALMGTVAYAPSRGVVTGGFQQCTALPVPGLPTYAAGSVTVLQGGTIVARQSVGSNEHYTFVLPPGDYVLDGRWASSNASVQVPVRLGAGDDLEVDIPNVCI